LFCAGVKHELSLSLMEARWLRVLENRVLRRPLDQRQRKDQKT